MENRDKVAARELAEGAQHLAEAMAAAGTTAEEAADSMEAALKAMQEAERGSSPHEALPRPPRSLISSSPAPPRTIIPTARAHLKQRDRKRAEPPAAGR